MVITNNIHITPTCIHKYLYFIYLSIHTHIHIHTAEIKSFGSEDNKSDLMSIMEQDIGQLLTTKIHAAVESNNSLLLSDLNIASSKVVEVERPQQNIDHIEIKQTPYYGIKSDYSDVKSKLFDTPQV